MIRTVAKDWTSPRSACPRLTWNSRPVQDQDGFVVKDGDPFVNAEGSLSNTNHEEDQPIHLRLKDSAVPIRENLPKYGEPARLYCPAGVFEVVYDDEASKTKPRFVINAQNCVHRKTCDIKDPAQNIDWTLPRRRRRPKSTGVAMSSEIRARRPRSTPKSTGAVFCLRSHAFPCRACEAGQGGAKAPRNKAVAASAGKRVKKVA